MAEVDPHKMVVAIVLIFVLSILGAVFTAPLQTEVGYWQANLTAHGQTAAAAIVGLIPLLFWVLLAVGIILMVVSMFLGSSSGLAVLPFVSFNIVVLQLLVLALCVYTVFVVVKRTREASYARKEASS